MKLNQAHQCQNHQCPAAFRRLCVETTSQEALGPIRLPAAFRRLCVETPLTPFRFPEGPPAAFRRLCVETSLNLFGSSRRRQPPSGGCVLKLLDCQKTNGQSRPAAFRRLCVETAHSRIWVNVFMPAAFRRLCVETPPAPPGTLAEPPAAFRRLCVETFDENQITSICGNQPPSGGCVLKLKV